MAQLERDLPYKNEYLSSIPRTHVKTPGTVFQAGHPGAREVERKGCL